MRLGGQILNLVDRRRFLAGLGLVAGNAILQSPTARAAPANRKLRLAGSIYVGWMPWFLADEDGTLRKIGNEFGLDIEFVRADYAETITLFGGGAVDAVVMTNVDAIPAIASAGIDADVLLIGSFSNGNDAILLRGGGTDDLHGKKLGLVEYSVSHYLLDRYLEQKGTPFGEVRWVNIADSAIAAAFASGSGGIDGVVTWNPIVDEIENRYGGRRLADSRSIGREIADMLVINRQVLRESPQAAAALLKIWFEITNRMRAKTDELNDILGRLSGADAASYSRQLAQTILLGTPESAVSTLQDPMIRAVSTKILAFVDRHQLISPRSSTPLVSLGDERPARLHFNPIPLQRAMAAGFLPASGSPR